MKFMNKALIVLAAVSLFGITGCKKKAEEAPKPEEIVQVQESLTTLNWTKGSPNSLLVNVPADTMAVAASMRLMDLDDPMAKPIMDYALKTFDLSIQQSEKQIQDLPPESSDTKRLKLILDLNKNTIRPLLADFANVAPQWGLDPKGHCDSIAYMNGNTPVMKMTVNDPVKFEAKVNEIMDQIGNSDPALKAAPKDVKAGESDWKVYSLKSLLKDSELPLPTEIAVNYAKTGVVTVAVVADNDTAALENALKPAATALTVDALGKSTAATAALGYLDVNKAFAFLTTGAGLEFLKEVLDLEDDDVTPECLKEQAGLAAMFPKYAFSYEINSASEYTSKNTLVMADREELKKIAGLHTQSLDIAKSNDLADLAVNIDLVKTMAYLTDLNTRASQTNYTCDNMKDIVKAIAQISDTVSNPMVANFAPVISGINVGLSKFNPEATAADGTPAPEIEAIVNISGAELASKLPLILTLLKNSEYKEIVNIVSGVLAAKGEVKEIDLKDQIQIPLKVNSLMTDTDLIVGTPNYDVKAISDGGKKDHSDFIRIAFSNALLALTPLEIEPALLNSSYDISLGTNDEGISFDLIFKNN